MPWLALFGQLTGAQLTRLEETEMQVTIHQILLLNDSKIMLELLPLDFSHFEMFVGTCVSEIQRLVDQ